MTEHALFHAYRNTTGYASECACGDLIESASGTVRAVGEAIRVHNASTVHQQWQSWQAAVNALKRPTRKPCPCRAGKS